MFSRTVEYALRAIVWLASRRDTPHTTREIARETQVPGNYLAKVLQTLVEAGIIESQRGLGGGFTLTRDPAALRVLEVVNAVDPLPRIRSCPLKLGAHAVQLCPLHRRLDDVLASVENALAASTIAELLADSGVERPLCATPAATPRQPAAGNLAAPERDANAPPAATARRSRQSTP